jgi:hypothetical protein
MNSRDARTFADGHNDRVLRGDYHGHPYGELNLVAPIDESAQLMGLQGWKGAGWTAPDPGSRHFPEMRGGTLIALFYLPAGGISYDFETPAVSSPRRDRPLDGENAGQGRNFHG